MRSLTRLTRHCNYQNMPRVFYAFNDGATGWRALTYHRLSWSYSSPVYVFTVHLVAETHKMCLDFATAESAASFLVMLAGETLTVGHVVIGNVELKDFVIALQNDTIAGTGFLLPETRDFTLTNMTNVMAVLKDSSLVEYIQTPEQV
jgi:hypothetical protein